MRFQGKFAAITAVRISVIFISILSRPSTPDTPKGCHDILTYTYLFLDTPDTHKGCHDILTVQLNGDRMLALAKIFAHKAILFLFVDYPASFVSIVGVDAHLLVGRCQMIVHS